LSDLSLELFSAMHGPAVHDLPIVGCDRASATDYAAFPGVLSLEPS